MAPRVLWVIHAWVNTMDRANYPAMKSNRTARQLGEEMPEKRLIYC
jgi:hypothetical protein